MIRSKILESSFRWIQYTTKLQTDYMKYVPILAFPRYGAHKGYGADATLWARDISLDYRKLLMAGAVEKVSESVVR